MERKDFRALRKMEGLEGWRVAEEMEEDELVLLTGWMGTCEFLGVGVPVLLRVGPGEVEEAMELRWLSRFSFGKRCCWGGCWKFDSSFFNGLPNSRVLSALPLTLSSSESTSIADSETSCAGGGVGSVGDPIPGDPDPTLLPVRLRLRPCPVTPCSALARSSPAMANAPTGISASITEILALRIRSVAVANVDVDPRES